MQQQAWLGLWPSETSHCVKFKSPWTPKASEKPIPPPSGKQLAVHWAAVCNAAVCEITAPVFPCLGYLWSHVALLPALQMGGTPGYDVRPLERAAETQASFSGNAADPSSLLGRWGCLDEQPQGLWLTALRLLGESWESRNRLEGRPLLGAEGPPSSTSPRE